MSYEQTVFMAESAAPFKAFIDPDLPEFHPPGDMPLRIREFCRQSGQYVPESREEILRVIYESLALKYRYFLEILIKVSGVEEKNPACARRRIKEPFAQSVLLQCHADSSCRWSCRGDLHR